MNSLVPFIQAAGAVQLGLAAANFKIRARLHYRENVARLSAIHQQISIVHWAYMAGILLVFSGLSFFFAPQLAGDSALGHYLSAAIALFWLSRCAIQLFYYDKDLRRENRVADVLFQLAFFFMAATYSAAAMGGLR